MEDILFLALYFTVPPLVFVLLKSAKINLLQFSIPSFVMLNMFVYAYIGILPLYFAWDDYRYYGNGVQDQKIILQVFLASSLTIISMALGMAYFKKWVGGHKNIRQYLSIRSLKKYENLFFLSFVVICIGTLVLYLKSVPSIALLAAILEGPLAAKAARSGMTNNFSGNYHWYKLFMLDGLFWATFVTFANSLLTKNQPKQKILFFGALLITAFSATASTQKGPLINLILGLFIIYTLIKKRGFYPWRPVLGFGTMIFTLLVFMYMRFMGSRNILSAILSIGSRVFTGQITPAYWYIEMFPQHQDFLWGRSFPNPGGILPFENYRLTVEVMQFKHPHLVDLNIVGSAPTVFWGELYANFGWLSLLFIPFIVGFLLYLMSELVNKLEDTPFKVGLIVFLALHYSDLAGTGLSGFIIDFYLICIVFIFIFISLLSNKGKLRLKNHL
jgi:oligosaccharide repeat unit polymerase